MGNDLDSSEIICLLKSHSTSIMWVPEGAKNPKVLGGGIISMFFFEHPDLLFQLGAASPCFASIAHTGDALGTRIPFQILATAIPKVSNSSPIYCGSCAAIFCGYVSKEQRRALEWKGKGVKIPKNHPRHSEVT